MKLTESDFLGRWLIEREITDFRMMENGSLQGQAHFTKRDDEVLYHESGTLEFAGCAPITAERTYLWYFTEGQIFVSYADGAPFHSFDPDGGPEASPHLCGEDMYRGTYAFTAFPDWQVTWSVKGPRKDYRSVTRYTRA